MKPLTQVPPTRAVSSEYLVRIIDDARQRTIDLTRDLGAERLLGPRLATVNPPLWEVGHVGFFHDHFVLRLLHGTPAYLYRDADRLYDSARVAHDERWELPLPDMAATLAYLGAVRAAMLERLPDGMASAAQSYVYQLATFHEDMHSEAFAYTRQTLGDAPPLLRRAAPPVPPEGAGALPGDVAIPGGRHVLGSDASTPFRFDNEKEPHELRVAPFAIARAPVTNAEFAAFVDAGGYDDPALWSAPGWQWRTRQGLAAPVYWRRGANGGWEVRRFDRWSALAPHQPVIHVSWFEADAWCRWAGRRLPSEAEWEVAASRVPTIDARTLQPGKRRYPWGDALPAACPANLDGWRLGCVDVAAFPAGDSAFGCRQMIGNVWEWTDSLFGPFPGFRPELYREYSEPWFAEARRVLRGGAWATRGRLVHNGFRNFFTPDRNDVLAGFRTCAR